MRDQYFYIEFLIGSTVRFEILLRMFTALKTEKYQNFLAYQSDTIEANFDAAEDPEWRDFLDEKAVEWFNNTFDHNSEEGKTYQKLWSLTSPEIRLYHPMFYLPGNWCFEATIESLFSTEYLLVELVQESEETGVLYYDPSAWPFGGTESLVALIESFGNTVTFDSYHEGPHPRRTSEWDYKLAKQLVLERKGFVPFK